MDEGQQQLKFILLIQNRRYGGNEPVAFSRVSRVALASDSILARDSASISSVCSPSVFSRS